LISRGRLPSAVGAAIGRSPKVYEICKLKSAGPHFASTHAQSSNNADAKNITVLRHFLFRRIGFARKIRAASGGRGLRANVGVPMKNPTANFLFFAALRDSRRLKICR
jgi:hypothetical protein